MNRIFYNASALMLVFLVCGVLIAYPVAGAALLVVCLLAIVLTPNRSRL